jgi:hypothetical protein
LSSNIKIKYNIFEIFIELEDKKLGKDEKSFGNRDGSFLKTSF